MNKTEVTTMQDTVAVTYPKGWRKENNDPSLREVHKSMMSFQMEKGDIMGKVEQFLKAP